MIKEKTKNIFTGLEIAIIGMAGRFPGAKNIDEFWENLKNGVESISFFSDSELEKNGIDPELLKDPSYVKAFGVVENSEYFDADFFGYSPTEAEIMDPQMRLFHECVWNALENAGYNPFSYDKLIGVYAGSSSNLFWNGLVHLSQKNEILGQFATSHLTQSDFLTTRVSYQLNLKGPSFLVQSACSTSLIAVHQACRALLTGECDIAIAGGIAISIPIKKGYLYSEGMIAPPDGHCRAFDRYAKGVCGGNGVGIVVLKPLQKAIEDKDNIYCVIKSTAVNNDGKRKVGFSAPSVEGQASVIKTAQRIARVNSESITYVETHGTGTNLGDMVEIEALKLGFNTKKKAYCLIGSVKTNIGHLDAAAGITGLIKTVLSIKNKMIPPSLFYEKENPKIDFKNSPFVVCNSLTDWLCDEYPIRASVSSFGIGGTNAHLILEEAPKIEKESETLSPKLFVLSAKTKTGLKKISDNLFAYIKKNPGVDLQNVAYTLQVGRHFFPHRRMIICSTVQDVLESLSPEKFIESNTAFVKDTQKPIVFMFSGLGSQYVDMGLGLYKNEPIFKRACDRCFEILKNIFPYDIRQILYPNEDSSCQDISRDQITGIAIGQVLIFILEYALSTLIIKWGIIPYALIGYSFGEYVAACVAGVFSLDDALKLVVARGELIRKIPLGAMISVPLPAKEIEILINDELSIAIDNGSSCIIAGNNEAIERFAQQMKGKKYICMPLQVSHAIHSKMMEPVLKEYEGFLHQVVLNKPQIEFTEIE